jgi:hypothetical protein
MTSEEKPTLRSERSDAWTGILIRRQKINADIAVEVADDGSGAG